MKITVSEELDLTQIRVALEVLSKIADIADTKEEFHKHLRTMSDKSICDDCGYPEDEESPMAEPKPCECTKAILECQECGGCEECCYCGMIYKKAKIKED